MPITDSYADAFFPRSYAAMKTATIQKALDSFNITQGGMKLSLFDYNAALNAKFIFRAQMAFKLGIRQPFQRADRAKFAIAIAAVYKKFTGKITVMLFYS